MIYKEDELGIKDSGGGEHVWFKIYPRSTADDDFLLAPDTELCPFDCDCCEFWYRYNISMPESYCHDAFSYCFY
jgi:hypothetical protein